ncbi:MAG: ATP-binding cassette domain-containing protein [Sulfolobales archaeon]
MEIELKNVWYTYDNVNYVFKGLTLRFSNGFHLIIGPNGSGKTTLLKIASLIYRPTKGEVFIDTHNFWNLDYGEMLLIKRNIVYVHEKALMIRGSVKTNLELGLKLRNINEDDVLRYFIDRYEIAGILHKDARRLSAGQAKLISLIRALAVKPKVLLLDEPLNHIDFNKVLLLLEDLIGLVKKGSTVIIATHYLIPELEKVITNIYEIVNGSLRTKL